MAESVDAVDAVDPLEEPPLDYWPVVGQEPGRLTMLWWWLLDVPGAVRAWVRSGRPAVVMLGAAGVLAVLALLGALLVLAGPGEPPAAGIRPATSTQQEQGEEPALPAVQHARPALRPTPPRITATVRGDDDRLLVRVRSSEWAAVELWIHGPAGRVVARRGLQVGPDGWSLRLTDLAAGDYRWRLVPADGRSLRGIATVTAGEPTVAPPSETTAPSGAGEGSGDRSDQTDQTEPADQPEPPEPIDPSDVPEPIDPDA